MYKQLTTSYGLMTAHAPVALFGSYQQNTTIALKENMHCVFFDKMLPAIIY